MHIHSSGWSSSSLFRYLLVLTLVSAGIMNLNIQQRLNHGFFARQLEHTAKGLVWQVGSSSGTAVQVQYPSIFVSVGTED